MKKCFEENMPHNDYAMTLRCYKIDWIILDKKEMSF